MWAIGWWRLAGGGWLVRGAVRVDIALREQSEDRVGKTQIVVYDDVMRLNKAQTLAGEFWLPGEPERKCSGRLSISENGELELTVKGKLAEDFSLTGSCDINYSKIFGDVETGDPVVLMRQGWIK